MSDSNQTVEEKAETEPATKPIEPTNAELKAKNVFKCSMCALYSKYVYYGTRPLQRHQPANEPKQSVSSNKRENLILMENTYVCDDPFSELKSANFLILGSNCSQCHQMVCMSNECSFFYFKKRFCLRCARDYMSTEEFSAEINSEIGKYIRNAD
jgi:hypothetical protein